MAKAYLPFTNTAGMVTEKDGVITASISYSIRTDTVVNSPGCSIMYPGDIEYINDCVSKLCRVYNDAVQNGFSTLDIAAKEAYARFGSENKISGIKYIRDVSGCGLKEAKNAYEAAEMAAATPADRVRIIVRRSGVLPEVATRIINALDL